MSNITQCIDALLQGEVIAYPTEGVFGVGCDPDDEKAIQKLLAVKARDKAKGLILVAADLSQLSDYIDFNALSDEIKKQVLSTWPGPVTWVMPKGNKATNWLTGQHDTIAVRVSAHPDVQALCREFGKPLTSTSANLTGQPPCLSAQEVMIQLKDSIACIFQGKTGKRNKPSEIREALTGRIVRQG